MRSTLITETQDSSPVGSSILQFCLLTAEFRKYRWVWKSTLLLRLGNTSLSVHVLDTSKMWTHFFWEFGMVSYHFRNQRLIKIWWTNKLNSFQRIMRRPHQVFESFGDRCLERPNGCREVEYFRCSLFLCTSLRICDFYAVRSFKRSVFRWKNVENSEGLWGLSEFIGFMVSSTSVPRRHWAV